MQKLDEQAQLMQLMQDLKFSKIGAEIYVLLLYTGPLNLSQVSQNIRQPLQQIEQTLERLIQLRLVGKDRRREHSIYYATNPALAWLSLVADLVWGVDVSLAPISHLPQTNHPNVEHLRMICNEVSTLSQQIYKPQVAALQHKEQDAETLDQLAQLTCEVIYQARIRICAVSKSPRSPQVSSFWSVLSSRIERGISYQRIVDLEEVIEHGLLVVKRDLDVYHIDLRILEQNEIQNKFYVVDNDRFLAIHHELKSNRQAQGVGRITTQREIVKRYQQRFERYHKRAIPASFVILHIEQAAITLLNQFRPLLASWESNWLTDLISYGKFSRFHVERQWTKEQRTDAENHLISIGALRRNSSGFAVPAYLISAADLRARFNPHQNV